MKYRQIKNLSYLKNTIKNIKKKVERKYIQIIYLRKHFYRVYITLQISKKQCFKMEKRIKQALHYRGTDDKHAHY